jgi:hypothetical protein
MAVPAGVVHGAALVKSLLHHAFHRLHGGFAVALQLCETFTEFHDYFLG